MKTTLITITFIFLSLIAGTAMAQGTPDGQTPAEELLCDNQSGAAFGLCNAYCEAMDCDCPTASNPTCEPRASATACTRVSDRYTQITGNGIVCEATPVSCPCLDVTDARWSEGDDTWVQFANGTRNVTSCSNVGGILTVESLDPNTFLTDSATVTSAGDSSSCALMNQELEATVLDTFAPISEAEAAACAALLEAGSGGACP